MCTPQQADMIRKEAGLWMQRGKSFTSVDVGNSLKQRGDWIKNREVAAFLRDNAIDFAPQYTQGRFTYKKSVINVTLPNGSNTEATLYHPSNVDPSTYKQTSQKALSPDEAQTDSPTSAQPKSPSPFAGLTADATGVRVTAVPGNLSSVDEEEDVDENPGDSGSHLGNMIAGVSEIRGFKPKPYQEVHLHIENVESLIITGFTELPPYPSEED